MSWDVLVLNYEGSPPADMDEMAEAGNPPPLGKLSAVQKAISRHLEGVDWSSPTSGIYKGDGFSIEFSLQKNDPVDAIMLSVRGEGDAIAAMLQFAQPNKWSLFDCSTSEFLDPDNPSHEGWQGFQALRNKAVKKTKNRKR